MAEGSQTFRARHCPAGAHKGTKEGVANADSPTNLMWRSRNDFTKASQAQKPAENTDDTPNLPEFTIDVHR